MPLHAPSFPAAFWKDTVWGRDMLARLASGKAGVGAEPLPTTRYANRSARVAVVGRAAPLSVGAASGATQTSGVECPLSPAGTPPPRKTLPLSSHPSHSLSLPSWVFLAGMVLKRQSLLNLVRGRGFMIARSIQALVMALIIGSLFVDIQPGTETWRNSIALCVLATIFLVMMSTPQVSLVFLTKRCVTSARRRGVGGKEEREGEEGGCEREDLD